MHTFISIVKRSLDEYNEDSSKDDNVIRMINAITLAAIIRNDGNINKDILIMTKKFNYLWNRYIRAKFYDINYTNYFHAMTKIIDMHKDEVFKMINNIITDYDFNEMDTDVVDMTYKKGIIAFEVR